MLASKGVCALNKGHSDKGLLRKSIIKLYSMPVVGEWFKQMSYERNVRKIVEHNSSYTTNEERASELERVYRRKIGRELNLENPISYTEKMQWSKLYDCTEIKGMLTDKYAVREWIKEKIGEEYLIPLLAIYDSPDDIEYKSLPDEFVIKMNNGSATNIICTNKGKLNKRLVKRKLNYWLKTPFSMMSWFEMHYDYIKPKILIEKYMHDEKTDDLRDYKFLCFDGVPYYVWVDFNRNTAHSRKVFNMNWELQEWNQFNYEERNIDVPRPETFNEMVKIVEILSEGFSHVRVDLYEINGKVYFGEMTFTNASGLEKIEPYEMDVELGNLWNLHM